MANWFDENGRETPETNANTPEPSPTENTASSASPSSPIPPASSDASPASEESRPVSGWSSPSSPVVPPASWNNAANAAPENDGTSSTASSSQTEVPETVTYRYGVHAPSPVPANEAERRAEPSSPSGGGYQPQGNYNPYGWQSYGQPPYGQQPTGGSPVQPGGSYPPPKRPKKKKGAAIAIATLSVACAALIVTLSVLLAVAVSNPNVPNTNTSTNNNSTTTTTRNVNNNAPTLDITDPDETNGLSTRAIVQKNLNSTVVITMYSKSGNSYFGQTSTGLTEAGAASGIIWTADGYIITNAHVVVNENTGKKYDKIDVELYDGTIYENAEVVGYDQYTDLAVIKVNATGLTTAEFGDSSQLQLGDKVVAIGNAGGLNFTTTQGIVSGLARDVYEDTGYAIKCLQVDAAINPGNSGGPLMNAQGQVVAINSAKIVASGYEGLGFSIPINEAKDILDDLVKYGYVKGRVMLGVTGRSITGTGFRIEEINSDSCLVGTEAQVGDIITAVDGVAVTDYSTMRAELSKHAVGDTVELTLVRVDSRTNSTRQITVRCVLAEATN